MEGWWKKTSKCLKIIRDSPPPFPKRGTKKPYSHFFHENHASFIKLCENVLTFCNLIGLQEDIEKKIAEKSTHGLLLANLELLFGLIRCK